MKNYVSKWIKVFLATIIHGGVTSALAVAGMTAGHSLVPASVPAVNVYSFLCAFGSGGLYAMFLFLKKSPLPGIVVGDNDDIEIVKTDDTSTLTKDQTKP